MYRSMDIYLGMIRGQRTAIYRQGLLSSTSETSNIDEILPVELIL